MAEKDNPLKAKIARLIEVNGPISLAEYMHICMADPEFGYYKNREAIGKKGDFITAPEISQIFGELIGIWCISAWRGLGKPSSFCLAELGPGKGTLMSDLLRAAKSDPEFLSAAQVVLVETSKRLKADQSAMLTKNLIDSDKINWANDIASLPDMPTIVIANEFLDVVPFHQYVKSDNDWNEIGITLDQNGNLQKVRLAGKADLTAMPKDANKEPAESVFEYSPAREAIVETLCDHIEAYSGACLLIDYGHLQTGFGDTFQAVAKHAFSDPLDKPGEHDLTSHVDFGALVESAKARNMKSVAAATQGEFLLALGLLERAGALGANQDDEGRNAIRAQVERLASPEQMGSLFKVFGFSSTLSSLPGLSNWDSSSA